MGNYSEGTRKVEDYSVTWGTVRPLFEEKLRERHIGDYDRVAFGTLTYLLEKTWKEIYEAKKEAYANGQIRT